MPDPLEGRKIVVTRLPHQADDFAYKLAALGANVHIAHLTELKPVADTTELEYAMSRIDEYDWLVFTSANGVRSMRRWARGARGFRTVRIAAVGPATAAAVERQLGVEPAFVPNRFVAEEIAPGLEPLDGKRILLPQADIADPALAEELRRRGALVEAIAAYRIVESPVDHGQELRSADAIVLMSGSAARSLANQGGPGNALIACIGPKTAHAARDAGLQVGLVAEEATADGIIQALVAHFGEQRA